MYGILILTAYLFLGNTAWSSMILLLGVCTMVVGAVLALFSVDLKRTLACSSVSQIGFILVGVGMSGLMGAENLIAVRGSLLHMVNHSLIKLTLFMAAGVVYMNVHTLDLNALRGFGRRKPLLHYIFLMGALGIGGVPLWNGYISKTLIHESIVEYTELVRNGSIAAVASMSALAGTDTLFSAGTLQWIEWAFLISGGLTVAYMTKLYVALFVEKNTDAAVQEKYDTLNGKYMNKVSAAALTISASLLPLMGFFPYAVMDRLSQMGQGFMNVEEMELAVSYFSLTNLKGAAISLVIGAAVYAVVVRLWMMRPVETTRTANTVKNPEDAKEYVKRTWSKSAPEVRQPLEQLSGSGRPPLPAAAATGTALPVRYGLPGAGQPGGYRRGAAAQNRLSGQQTASGTAGRNRIHPPVRLHRFHVPADR